MNEQNIQRKHIARREDRKKKGGTKGDKKEARKEERRELLWAPIDRYTL